MNRDAFLARVRTAAASGRSYRVSTGEPQPIRVGYVGGGDDLVTRMSDEISQVGGFPQIVDDHYQAMSAVLEIAAARNVTRALCWRHPVLDAIDLRTRLREAGIAWDDYDSLAELDPEARRQQILAAELGITSATWAIAETGTLVMASEPGRERVASLLPPTHVAVVERAQILPDLFDVFDALGAQPDDDLPSNAALITGPSKTGDLELKLTTGVHGPREWHVVLIR